MGSLTLKNLLKCFAPKDVKRPSPAVPGVPAAGIASLTPPGTSSSSSRARTPVIDLRDQEKRELEEAIALSMQDGSVVTVPAELAAPEQVAASAPVESEVSVRARPGATVQDGQASDATARAGRKQQRSPAEVGALAQLSELVANCIEANAQFVDPEFAPSLRVLYINGKCRKDEADQLLIVQHYERQHGREISWRRPGQILQRPDDLMMEFASREEMVMTMQQMSRMVEWRVFQSDPDPMDISQGALGNCWFCGSLAAVAEKPQLVKRLFLDDYARKGELSPVGAYLLKLCDGGEWRHVILDDHFPCNKGSMLAYSGARRNQLWVPLLEKAFAKLRGCYEETEGGNPAEGLRLFTGWPSIVLQLQASEEDEEGGSGGAGQQARFSEAMQVQANCPFVDEDLLWVRLVSAHSADLIMCGSCGHVSGLTRQQYRDAGLSPSHCYSIVLVAAAQGGALRLVKLRNPWGTGLKWKGAFSDTDTENWTQSLKEEVGATDLGRDGGIFWMALKDLRRYFNSITICPYRSGWRENHVTAEFPTSMQGAQPAVFLERPPSGQPTEALLSLMQPEERQSTTTMTADLGMVLLRVPRQDAPREDGQQVFGASAAVRQRLQFVDSMPRKVRDTSLADQFVEEGDESAGLLAVPISFNQRAALTSDPENVGGAAAMTKKFTFACFSARDLPVRPVSVAPEVIREALVAHVQKRGVVGTQSGGIKLWKLVEAGLVVYLENASMTFVEISVELTELFNMAVSRGTQASATGDLAMRSRDVVPPMHGMIVFVAASMPAGHSYRFSARFAPLQEGAEIQHRPPLAEPADPLHDPFYLEGRQPFQRQHRATSGGTRRSNSGRENCEQQ